MIINFEQHISIAGSSHFLGPRGLQSPSPAPSSSSSCSKEENRGQSFAQSRDPYTPGQGQGQGQSGSTRPVWHARQHQLEKRPARVQHQPHLHPVDQVVQVQAKVQAGPEEVLHRAPHLRQQRAQRRAALQKGSVSEAKLSYCQATQVVSQDQGHAQVQQGLLLQVEQVVSLLQELQDNENEV